MKHQLKGYNIFRLTKLRYKAAQYPTESNLRPVREELKMVRAEQAAARANRVQVIQIGPESEDG